MDKAYRQGELLFIPIKMPKWVDREKQFKKMDSNVIREGEVSGHKHEVEGQGTLFSKTSTYIYGDNGVGDGESFQLPEGEMVLTAQNNLVVKHPEHKSLNLPKGDYVIRIQREYIEGSSRRVND